MIHQVRQELNEMRDIQRKLKKCIPIWEDAIKRVERQRAELMKLEQTDEVILLCDKLLAIAKNYDIERYINEATALEQKYQPIIDGLDAVSKAVVIDCILNGQPYWKVGQKLHWSEISIKRKVKYAIAKIAKKLEDCD